MFGTQKVETTGVDLTGVMACLLLPSLRDDFGGDGEWFSLSKEQEFVLSLLASADSSDILCTPGLDTISSWNYQEINQFLQEHGFNIQLSPFDGLGMASVLKFALTWQFEGNQQLITTNRQRYSGFELDIPQNQIYVFDVQGTRLVRMKTANDYTIYFVLDQTSQAPPLDFSAKMIDLIDEAITKMSVYADYSWTKLILPDVSLDIKPDISALLGMYTHDQGHNRYALTQAKQQIRFSMDYTGAQYESATAMAATLGGTPQEKVLLVDKPFYMGIGTPELGFPTIFLHIGYDSWL